MDGLEAALRELAPGGVDVLVGMCPYLVRDLDLTV